MAGGVPTSSVGASVAATSGVVSVGGTSVAVLGNNPSRIGGRLQNDHATQIIYVALATAKNTAAGQGDAPTAPTAELNKGFRLLPVGANSLDLAGYTGPVAAIASGSSTPCLVTEF